MLCIPQTPSSHVLPTRAERDNAAAHNGLGQGAVSDGVTSNTQALAATKKLATGVCYRTLNSHPTADARGPACIGRVAATLHGSGSVPLRFLRGASLPTWPASSRASAALSDASACAIAAPCAGPTGRTRRRLPVATFLPPIARPGSSRGSAFFSPSRATLRRRRPSNLRPGGARRCSPCRVPGPSIPAAEYPVRGSHRARPAREGQRREGSRGA
jgi:hypothetical protein